VSVGLVDGDTLGLVEGDVLGLVSTGGVVGGVVDVIVGGCTWMYVWPDATPTKSIDMSMMTRRATLALHTPFLGICGRFLPKLSSPPTSD
jgi:hypothetical protein